MAATIDLLRSEALDLRAFQPGALVWTGRRLHRVSDPLRMPSALVDSALAPVGSPIDKARLAVLLLRLRHADPRALLHGDDTTTIDALRAGGFSQRMIDRFFRPLVGGIQLDRRSRRLRMAGDVAERLSRHLDQLAGRPLGERVEPLALDLQLEVDHRVETELLGEGGEARAKPGPLEELGAEPEDEVADVADRQVQRLDRPLDPRARLGRVVAHQLGDIVEREGDRVDRLDDPVVEVLPDPLALLDHGESGDLLVEAGVVDRDRRMIREEAMRHRVPFLYVNQVGGNDELVFDGHSIGIDASGHEFVRLADAASA